MRTAPLVAWIVAITEMLCFVMGIYSSIYTIYLYITGGMPPRSSDLDFYLAAIGQLVITLVFGLSALSLGLILTYAFDLRNVKFCQWSLWQRHDGKISIGAALALALKLSAVMLMILGFINVGQVFVFKTQPNFSLMAGISVIVWTLMQGFSFIAIAVILEKVRAVPDNKG